MADCDARMEAYLADPAGVAARHGCALTLCAPVLDVPQTTRRHADLVAEANAHLQANNMTNVVFAGHLGVNQAYVSQWRNGALGESRVPQIDARVAAYLHDPTTWAAQFAAHTASVAAHAATHPAPSTARASKPPPVARNTSKRSVGPAVRFEPPLQLHSEKKRKALVHDVSGAAHLNSPPVSRPTSVTHRYIPLHATRLAPDIRLLGVARASHRRDAC